MRVYEFAKEKGLSSKEVINLLEKGGYEVASHMSVVPEKALEYLNNVLPSKKSNKASSEPINNKKEISAVKKSEIVSEKLPLNKKTSEKSVEQIKIKAKPQVAAQKLSFKPEGFSRRNSFQKKVITEINISGPTSLFEVARLMGKSDGDLIFVLLHKGVACNRTYILDIETIKSLGAYFGITVNVEKPDDFTDEFLSLSSEGKTRSPIVVVMGHVDHGKTTLLDFLRNKNTAAKEKGGITQHLGTYEVDSKHGKIVFLDTPGHEAFTYMRSQGAKITDLAILIIAADDGVKPQTIEAIKHAKESGVPIIVAINKIDKLPEDKLSNAIQTIYRELAEKDVLVEDWGGDIIALPISAKTGQGVNELLEMIVLQSEMMDLKADADQPAQAFVLESNLEKGFGPVATVIPMQGTLRKGNYFICGDSTGKVRLLIDSFGRRINEAGPAVPVKVIGFDNFAEIGGWLNVVSEKKYRKVKSNKKTTTIGSVQNATIIPAESTDAGQINLILKTDTHGSKEAVESSIRKLSKVMQKDYARLNVITSSIGDVSENDVELANTTGATILCLHTKVERKALNLAQTKKVIIKTFDVIYHLIEYLEEELKKTKKVEVVWIEVAQLLVKKLFHIKKLGIIAGCSVQEGTAAIGNKVVCVRGNQTIGEGFIKSLQHNKKVVKEVHAGYECGFISDNFQDWKESDIVHVFAQEKVAESGK